MSAREPARRGGRISAGAVFLVIALVGSVAYVLFAVTVRDASQMPMLASATVVLGLVFGALALYCLRSTWRAGTQGRGGRALLVGVIGGLSAIAAAGAIAGAFIMFSLANGLA